MDSVPGMRFHSLIITQVDHAKTNSIKYNYQNEYTCLREKQWNSKYIFQRAKQNLHTFDSLKPLAYKNNHTVTTMMENKNKNIFIKSILFKQLA